MRGGGGEAPFQVGVVLEGEATLEAIMARNSRRARSATDTPLASLQGGLRPQSRASRPWRPWPTMARSR